MTTGDDITNTVDSLLQEISIIDEQIRSKTEHLSQLKAVKAAPTSPTHHDTYLHINCNLQTMYPLTPRVSQSLSMPPRKRLCQLYRKLDNPRLRINPIVRLIPATSPHVLHSVLKPILKRQSYLDEKIDNSHLRINPILRVVSAPTPHVLHRVFHRLRIRHRKLFVYRELYTATVEAFKETVKAHQLMIQAVMYNEDQFKIKPNHDCRAMFFRGDTLRSPTTLTNIQRTERQIRALRRTSKSLASQSHPPILMYGKSPCILKKPENCRANVCKYVPYDYGAMVDPMCRRLEDPLREYYDAKHINPWILSERILFLKSFLSNGKNFSKSAKSFNFKTAQDLSRFYYEQKLTYELKDLRKRKRAKQVITDNEIINLASVETLSATMAWNFEEGLQRDSKTPTLSEQVAVQYQQINAKLVESRNDYIKKAVTLKQKKTGIRKKSRRVRLNRKK